MKTPAIQFLPVPCAEWANRLAALHPDDLTPEERAALRAHVAHCGRCAAVYAAYQAMDERILSLPAVQPSAEQVAQVRALVTDRRSRQARRGSAGAGRPPRQMARWGRAAGALAALMVVALVVGSLYGLFTARQTVNSRTPTPSPGTAAGTGVAGVIYAVSDTGTVFAVSANTGKIIWSTPLHVQASEQFVVAGGKVFVGDNNDVLYALQASDGHLVWSHSYKALTTVGDQTVQIAPYPASDGKALFFGAPTGIYAWNASDGQTLWSYPAPAACSAPGSCEPEVMTVSNGVVYAYLDGLYALNAATGTEMWQAAQVPSDTPLVVAENNVFVGGNNTPLRVFQASDGKLLETPDLAEINPPDELMTNGSVVFVRTHDISVGGMDVYGVRASDGKVLWSNQYYNGQGFDGVFGDSFFFTSISEDTFTQTTPVTDPTGNSQQEYAGYLCAASSADGSIQWCLQLLGNFTTSPGLEVVRQGTLFITTLGGVEAVRISDGQQVWFALDSVALARIEFD